MDRSFLSDTAVIAASRAFVCARLATYESAAEGKLLESIFVGRSGKLENTTFVILAPDGKTKLSRAGRGPQFAYRGAADLAKGLRAISKRHPGRKGSAAKAPLPLCEDVRRGLNIASCDGRSLVVVRASSAKQRKVLEAKLAPLAWRDDLIGRARYAATTDDKELAAVRGAKKTSAYLVIQPGAYGLDGRVLAQAPASATPKDLAAVLARGIGAHAAPTKSNIRRHVSKGKRDGVHWETEVPVSDPGGPPPRRGPRR